jgi:hypothetical protein
MTAPTWNRPADQVRSAAEQKYDRIRQNTDIRPEVALKQMAKAYSDTKGQLDQMAGGNSSSRVADLAAAKRSLFGIDDLTKKMTPAEATAAAMSFRDAQKHAATIGSETEAQALLDQADQTGDELLARAVGNQAISGLGMPNVAQAYLATRPGKQDALSQVRALQRPLDVATLLEFATPKPGELSHLSDVQISQMAGS